MKKVVLVFFLLTLLASTASASFSDVDEGHENYNAIIYVQSAGIVEGYSDGMYRPDSTINRAEFTKIIIESRFSDEAIESCLGNSTLSFSDVVVSEWYAKYVCVAFEEGIVSGYPDGTYGSAKYISIVEAAKIIVNAYDIETEVDDIWYKPYMVAMGDRGALPTSITEFEQEITRGEMAEMIYRLEENITVLDSTSYYEIAGEAEPEGDTAELKEFTIIGEDYTFDPGEMTVSEGDTVRITFVNEGDRSHNLKFDDLEYGTSTLSPGEFETIEFTAPSAGSYTFYCGVGSHRDAGMEGTLVVE